MVDSVTQVAEATVRMEQSASLAIFISNISPTALYTAMVAVMGLKDPTRGADEYFQYACFNVTL